jgi:predicted nucleic acid-binding protein
MNTLVLDASVAAKWFLPAASEPLRDEALELLKGYAAGDLRFLVPDFFWPELGNIFWKAVRQQRWSQSEAEAALGSARDRNFPTLPSVPLLGDAFSIALAFDRSVYDSLYVAAALAAKTDLVTADERLANALAAHLPVKWLGTYT